MGLIPQTKCARCDRKYSGLRTRCPFCGARRRKKGTRTVTNDNSTWKMVVGLLLLVVLIAAVIVLIVTSVSENKDNENVDNDQQEQEDNAIISSNEGVNSEDSNTIIPPIDDQENEPDEPDEPEDVTPAVTSVIITYGGSALSYNDSIGMYDLTMKLTDVLTLGVKVTPDDTGLEPVWSVDDESKVVVLQSGQITAIGSGNATITVTVGDVTASAYVRIKS